jgi:hypothetical protein
MANGTIAFDTLQTSGQITGTAKSVDTDYVVNGSAKAWVNFQGTDTFGINDSFNVTSCDDNGTGDYDINITSAFSNASFSSTSSCTGDSSNDNRGVCTNNSSTSEVYINAFICTSGAVADEEMIHFTGHGDLA